MDQIETVLYGAAGLFLLYKIIAGWRLGPMRQLVRVCALIAAIVTFNWFGHLLMPLLRLTKYPDLLLAPVSAIVGAIAVYLVITTVGNFLFRKTTEQGFGFIWLFYGMSGAALGGALGMIFLVLLALGLRCAGTFAEGVAIAKAPPSRPAVPGSEAKVAQGSYVITAKHSLEQGWRGTFLDLVDPISEARYEQIYQFGRLAAQPSRFARLADYAPVAPLLKRKELLALRDDPKIADAIRQNRYLPLLQHPRVLEAANNPEIAAVIRQLDFGKLFGYLLENEVPPLPNAIEEGQESLPAATPATTPAPTVQPEPIPAATTEA